MSMKSSLLGLESRIDVQCCDIRSKACETQVYPVAHRKDLRTCMHATSVIQYVPWKVVTYLLEVHGYRHRTRTKTQITGDSDAIFAGHCDDRSAIMIHYRLQIDAAWYIDAQLVIKTAYHVGLSRTGAK